MDPLLLAKSYYYQPSSKSHYILFSQVKTVIFTHYNKFIRVMFSLLSYVLICEVKKKNKKVHLIGYSKKINRNVATIHIFFKHLTMTILTL